MNPSIFISYSRREVPFIDTLLDALEDKGFPVWVDYQSLVPGRPWLDQILSGIDTADLVLLVISKASVVSKNVEMEYQRALEKKKRIILLIFETVPLPASLHSCEWIDFRGSFNRKLKQLIEQINLPKQQPLAPQSGFKTSFIVWLTLIISVIVLVISIPAWWTIFIPAVLVPLPYHIVKRDVHYYRARFALLTLPIILLLSWIFFRSYEFTNVPIQYCVIASLFIAPLLLVLLSSKGMRVWGKPGSSAPRFANPYHPDIRQPEAVPFFIEYAPEDLNYANTIINGLTSYGHPQVTDVEQAKVSFAIISHYKNTISINVEERAVFPILVQDTVIEDKNLLRIQWIDFRRGLRNLKNLAKLLPEPAKLMKSIGSVPVSNQVVYPRVIQMIDYFLTLLAFFTVSIWIPLCVEFGRKFLELDYAVLFIILNMILTAIILTIIFFSRRALIQRQGRLSSLGWLIGSTLFVGFVSLLQALVILFSIIGFVQVNGVKPPGDMRGSVLMFLPLSYTLGIILIGFFSLLNLGDLLRWFPKRQEQDK
ncbi:MAG: toll/interleukin-1 receptor domain-containing protein [Anaerolineales bacterium]|nr:toll/interleukin-1 receptor domain-containing protein [Anaerolineales bacterium]